MVKCTPFFSTCRVSTLFFRLLSFCRGGGGGDEEGGSFLRLEESMLVVDKTNRDVMAAMCALSAGSWNRLMMVFIPTVSRD